MREKGQKKLNHEKELNLNKQNRHASPCPLFV